MEGRIALFDKGVHLAPIYMLSDYRWGVSLPDMSVRPVPVIHPHCASGGIFSPVHFPSVNKAFVREIKMRGFVSKKTDDVSSNRLYDLSSHSYMTCKHTAYLKHYSQHTSAYVAPSNHHQQIYQAFFSRDLHSANISWPTQQPYIER